MAEPNERKRPSGFFAADLHPLQRINHGVMQAAEGNIWPLRHDQDALSGREHDAAASPGPATGNGANQRALSGAGLPRDQHAFATENGGIGMSNDRPSIVER